MYASGRVPSRIIVVNIHFATFDIMHIVLFKRSCITLPYGCFEFLRNKFEKKKKNVLYASKHRLQQPPGSRRPASGVSPRFRFDVNINTGAH